MSGSFNDRYGGWGATLVDALDSLWILDLKEDFVQAVDAAVKIDFSDPSLLAGDKISTFETTIRFLGGFLAAYELSDCKDLRLLEKAIEVGDLLYAAFDTPTRMPTNTWDPRVVLETGQGPIAAVDDNIMANVASLSLEFTRLSQLTGDSRYFDAVQRVTITLAEQQGMTKLPGMWPQRYNNKLMDFTEEGSFTLGAEQDSGYEYLLKMVLLLGNQRTDTTRLYENMYRYAMDTATQRLFFRPLTPDDSEILLSGKVVGTGDDNSLIPESEHLACFQGGMLALGGKIFENATHLDFGMRLTEGCVWAYRASPSGIAPENFATTPCQEPSTCKWNETHWELEGRGAAKGFTAARDRQYHLRPEAIESLFYMHRISGEEKYQDMAWEMFQSIERQTRTKYGNAKLVDVFADPAPKTDFMESFWLCETLKYLYLIFSPPDLISLDDFVLSTEAHPFRIPKP